jgi:DNA polymerase III subunit beta
VGDQNSASEQQTQHHAGETEIESMKIHASVLVSELQAMRLFALEDESRYVLNGVLVEVWPDKTLIVATDGRRLAVLKSRAFCETPPPDEMRSFIIPNERLKRISSVKKKDREDEANRIDIFFECDDGTLHLRHDGAGQELWGKAIKGNYPGWRKVVPTGDGVAIPVTGFNARYFADFVKVAKLLGASDTGFVAKAYPGDAEGKIGPAEFRLSNLADFYSVIMTLDISKAALPEKQPWLGLQPIEQKAA